MLRIYLKQCISGSSNTTLRPALVFVTKLGLLHVSWIIAKLLQTTPHLPPKEVGAMHNASKRAPHQHLYYPTMAM